MLSRVADSLFWMSRYIERAENIGRIIDVNLQLLIDVPMQESKQLKQNWTPLAACMGSDGYFKKSKPRTRPTYDVIADFLVFHYDNPNSIARCIGAARENARTVREQISGEMWEQINRSYHWLNGREARRIYINAPYEFFQRVKEISQLFQGLTDGTMSHGEEWEFIQLGKYIERADKTTRILDPDFQILDQIGDSISDRASLQWNCVLQMASARQAYQRLYLSDVSPEKVTKLLMLDERFSRSVRFCVQNMDGALRRISGSKNWDFDNPVERLSGQLLSYLCFSTVDDFMVDDGLHEKIDEIQKAINHIGVAMQRFYNPIPEKTYESKPTSTQSQSQSQTSVSKSVDPKTDSTLPEKEKVIESLDLESTPEPKEKILEAALGGVPTQQTGSAGSSTQSQSQSQKQKSSE